MRRAERAGAVVVDVVSAREILERDEWTCWLCGEAIDPAATFPDHGAASLDHVVPLSEGGDHGPANVRAAHFICNASRRAVFPESV